LERSWVAHAGWSLLLPLVAGTAPSSLPQPIPNRRRCAKLSSRPRVSGLIPFNIPAAISSVSAEQLRNDALGVNLSDDMATVPGLLARNRNNYAQDQQISIRGHRCQLGVRIRGVRVYQDGIPATGPDGQGQVSQFNLDSASRVEILRAPFRPCMATPRVESFNCSQQPATPPAAAQWAWRMAVSTIFARV